MSSIPLPPGLRVNGFSMAPAAVTRAHSSPFGGDGAEAVVDLLQDRWRASFSTTATTRAESGAVEAWLAAQRGGANTTPLHHFARPYPLGTLGRQHAVYGLLADAAQGADSVQLATVPGATLLAGDMVGVSGLLLQCAADCVADGQGVITVPLVNRLRRALVGFRRASTATFVDAAGVLQTAAAHVARFQGGQLLVELAATNHFLNSQNIGAAPWVNCSAVLAAETYRGMAPFWTVAKITSSSSESRNQNAKTVAVGEVGTITAALLAGSVSQCSMGILLGSGWGLQAASTAEILEGPGVISARGGSLCTVTSLSATIPTLLRITRTFDAAGTAGTQFFPGVHTSTTIGHSVKLTRVQYEVGSVATSYIPTAAAPATRAADVMASAEWDKPTRPFRLASRAGVRHAAGYAEGLALDFVEDLTP